MLYDVFVNYFQIFLMVLIRTIGLFMSAPFYAGIAMPMRFKLSFAFFTTLVAVPLVIGMGVTVPGDLASYGVKLLSNFVFGAGVGFFIFFITTAFQQSAQIFSIQMGMGMNEVFDPISDTQVPALGNILGIMIILLLLRSDGQFTMIQIIVDSFRSVDVLNPGTVGIIIKGLLSALLAMFDVSLKIALPIIGVTVLLDVAMGLISRVAPQFNVMIMGFNIKLIAGFVIVWLILPSAVDLGDMVLQHMFSNVSEWVRAMGLKKV